MRRSLGSIGLVLALGCGGAEVDVEPTAAAAAAEASAAVTAIEAELRELIERQLWPERVDLERLQARLGEVLDRWPDEPGARALEDVIVGRLLVLDGRVDEARARFEVALTSGQPLLAGYFLGWTYLATDQPELAWGELNASVALDPGWTPARFARAAAAARFRVDAEDLLDLQRALVRWPEVPEVALAFAHAVDGHGGDPDGAAAWYRRAVALGSTDPRAIERFTTDGLESGDVEATRQTLAGLVAADPARADLRLHLGRAHERAGALDQAELELSNAVGLDPESRDAALQLATYYLNHGHVEDGVELLTELDQRHPGDAEILSYLGHATHLAGDHAAAAERFARACRAGALESCAMACGLGDQASCDGPGGRDPFADRRLDGVEMAEEQTAPRRSRRRGGGFLISTHSLGAASSPGASGEGRDRRRRSARGDSESRRPAGSRASGARGGRSASASRGRPARRAGYRPPSYGRRGAAGGRGGNGRASAACRRARTERADATRRARPRREARGGERPKPTQRARRESRPGPFRGR